MIGLNDRHELDRAGMLVHSLLNPFSAAERSASDVAGASGSAAAWLQLSHARSADEVAGACSRAEV